MGPRQFLQYRIKLETLAGRCGLEGKTVVHKANIILNLNADVYPEAKNDLIRNNFYGFNPGNIYVLVQPTYKSQKI